MKRGALMAFAVAVLVGTVAAGAFVADTSVNYLAGRYPGAERVTSEAIDLAYVRRGWVSRRSVFQTADELGAVERWYSARYGPVSEAEAHASQACAGFRTTRQWARLVYAVGVTLCGAPGGTRIVLDESVFYSPQPPAQAP